MKLFKLLQNPWSAYILGFIICLLGALLAKESNVSTGFCGAGTILFVFLSIVKVLKF